MNKAIKIVSNVLYFVLFGLLLLMTIIVISSRASGGEPELFGYQFKTVLSGSMEPTFKTGSIIMVEKLENPQGLVKDDVITFKQDAENVVTHRIIEVVKQGENVFYQTKGDNNDHADMNPVMTENVIAKYSGVTVPFVGYFLQYAGSPIGTAILLIIPGLLLLGYAAWTIRSAIKEIEVNMKRPNTQESPEKIVS